jgi:hypothetical protein
MTPADIVISRFGGVRPLARLLGKDPSTIHRWKQPAERGGLDGRVPSAVQVRLLELAREKGVDLTPADLVLGSTCSAGAVESTGRAGGVAA